MKQKWLRKICVGLGCLYVLFVVWLTVYSQTAYIDGLPEAVLVRARSKGISAVYEGEGTVRNSQVQLEIDVRKSPFLMAVYPEGSRAELEAGGKKTGGSVARIDYADGWFRLTVTPEKRLPEGETAAVTLHSDRSVILDNVVPRTAVSTDAEGFTCVNLVEQADGPWGKRYVVRQQRVTVLPESGSEEVSVLGGPLGNPVAKTIGADAVYAGMEVRLSAEE